MTHTIWISIRIWTHKFTLNYELSTEIIATRNKYLKKKFTKIINPRILCILINFYISTYLIMSESFPHSGSLYWSCTTLSNEKSCGSHSLARAFLIPSPSLSHTKGHSVPHLKRTNLQSQNRVTVKFHTARVRL